MIWNDCNIFTYIYIYKLYICSMYNNDLDIFSIHNAWKWYGENIIRFCHESYKSWGPRPRERSVGEHKSNNYGLWYL